MTNEFRKDPVSGDWLLIAPGRAHRPDAPESQRVWEDSYQKLEDCPLEHLLSDQFVTVVANEFPVFDSRTGVHELVITRDHDRHMADFSDDEIAQILTAYQNRYQEIAKDPKAKYISICHNYRREAGATVWHNHSQILSVPMIPPRIQPSAGLDAADQMLWENDLCALFCPFFSQTPYEMRIMPKRSGAEFSDCAQVLGVALRAVKKGLQDAPYNFYIHTSPVGDNLGPWHIEIVPKLKIDGGFELGTGLYVNPVDPDAAAEHLQKFL